MKSHPANPTTSITLTAPPSSGTVCATGGCGTPSCGLPSGDSACALMNGDLKAIPVVLLHMTGRAALIGVGIYAAGERDLKKVAKYGAAAAGFIEVFALAWAGTHRWRHRRA